MARAKRWVTAFHTIGFLLSNGSTELGIQEREVVEQWDGAGNPPSQHCFFEMLDAGLAGLGRVMEVRGIDSSCGVAAPIAEPVRDHCLELCSTGTCRRGSIK